MNETTFSKRRHHYPCTIKNKNVFWWGQSYAQNIVDFEIFLKIDWYTTQMAEKCFEI